jgi:antitoxin HigA-1
MIPLGISQYRLAKEIGFPEPRISAICNGKRAITADMAVGWRGFSALVPVSGLVYRPITIPRKSKILSRRALSVIHKWNVNSSHAADR